MTINSGFTLDDIRFPVNPTNLTGFILDDIAFPIAIGAVGETVNGTLTAFPTVNGTLSVFKGTRSIFNGKGCNMTCGPNSCGASGVGQIPIGADFTIQLDKVRTIDNVYLNNGTATYTLTERFGTETVVASGSLAYVAASNGRYRGTIDASITEDLIENEFYELVVYFTLAGYDDERHQVFQARYRK